MNKDVRFSFFESMYIIGAFSLLVASRTHMTMAAKFPGPARTVSGRKACPLERLNVLTVHPKNLEGRSQNRQLDFGS